MGTLIPADIDLTTLEPSERRVIEALVGGTDPSWLILPNVAFVDNGKDGEADVVLLNPSFGAVVLEVKGGAIAVREGAWFQNGHRLAKSPVKQAVRGKHALKKKAEAVADMDEAGVLQFTHGVAFPDVHAVPLGWLGADLEARMIFTEQELQWPDKALEKLMDRRAHPASVATMKSIVRAFRPTLDFNAGVSDQFEAIGRRLDERTEEVLQFAEALDANKRILVTGPAGSGKSRLAKRWAQQASARGEKVLLISYNVPISSKFELEFVADRNVTAGTFHQIALDLLASTGFEPPETRTTDFWDDEVPTALFDACSQLTTRFDTIIIDEAQDFREHWLLAIDGLLDPDGADRLYLLRDEHQDVRRVDAASPEGFFTLPLSTNCRNTKAIAAVAEHLGGGESYATSPEGEPVHFIPVDGLKVLRKKLAHELTALRNSGIAPSDIAVITTRADLRDQILDPPLAAAQLVRWEGRDEAKVVCETAHRLKGTEWQAVILVNLQPKTDWLEEILYVGVSRATTHLSVLATRETGDLLGLTS